MQRTMRAAALAVGLMAGASACTPAEIHLFEAVHHVDFTAEQEKALATFKLPPPSKPMRTSFVGGGCGAVRNALIQAGATSWEVSFGTNIARRESNCSLGAHNYNRRTGDNSYGPFQINYYGPLAGRTHTIGSPESNRSSWLQAAKNFLKLGRSAGWCHWKKPNYCA